MKKKNPPNELEKLIKLTKLIKDDKVKVEPKALPRSPNKWRSQQPKFNPQTSQPGETVEGGGMQVDPALKSDYDNWRQDKIEEQNFRREQAARRARAAAEKRRLAEQDRSA